MATATLTGTTMTADQVFAEIQKTGVSRSEAQVLVGNWILANAGARPKTFAFKTLFDAVEPACAPQFARAFVHQDWVDGEDVVQAEQTTGEEGFNLRFHRIEGDLDSLGQDVAEAFACLSAMRASLRLLLDELQTELNLVYRAIAGGGGGGKIVDPRPLVPGNYLGATRFFEKDVHVFESDRGMIVLPSVEPLHGTPFVNPRVQKSVDVGKFLLRDDVQKFFQQHGAMSTHTFVDKFGDELLESGMTVRDALDIIPGGSRFKSPDALLDGLATREGAAIRTSGIEDESLAAIFGLEGRAKLADAPLDRFESIPGDARAALTKAGITTVGAFAGRKAADVAKLLQRQGVQAAAGDVAGWLGASKTLVNAR